MLVPNVESLLFFFFFWSLLLIMCQILANIKSDYFVSHDKMYNSELWDTGKKNKEWKK